MTKSKIWMENPELDFQLFKVVAANRESNGFIPWAKLAKFVADGTIPWKSCHGRYYYQLDQTRTFCKEIEKVQAQFGAIPDAAQPKKQNKSGLSANQLAHEEEKIEGDPSDSDSSATGSEPGQEQSPAIPLREAPQKNQGKRRNNENPKARKEKKKKFRRYNKAKGAGTITTASSATTNPFAIASGAVAPSQGARWSSAVTAAHDSNSGMAAIAQKEVLRAIGNALLQKVGQ